MDKMNLCINFDKTEDVKKFIHTAESGMYNAKNTDGENVIVMISKGVGMDVRTLQKNGWLCIHEYDEFGTLISETYDR